jgi:DNA-binding PadR family transcriptional regulator
MHRALDHIEAALEQKVYPAQLCGVDRSPLPPVLSCPGYTLGICSTDMSVPLMLLGLLDREPSHGYDLKRDYDTYFGRDKPVPFGQVYSTLARLVRDGKVTPSEVEPGTARERKRYSITDLGRGEVEGWLMSPVDPEPHLQPLLFVKVVLALMLGRSAERYLDAQKKAHLRRMREFTKLRRSNELIDSLLADYGLFHLEADLRWIELASSRLTALAEEVLA